MVSYMLDALRQKELALAGVWLSLGLANLSHVAGIMTSDSNNPASLTLMMIFIPGGAMHASRYHSCRHFQRDEYVSTRSVGSTAVFYSSAEQPVAVL